MTAPSVAALAKKSSETFEKPPGLNEFGLMRTRRLFTTWQRIPVCPPHILQQEAIHPPSARGPVGSAASAAAAEAACSRAGRLVSATEAAPVRFKNSRRFSSRGIARLLRRSHQVVDRWPRLQLFFQPYPSTSFQELAEFAPRIPQIAEVDGLAHAGHGAGREIRVVALLVLQMHTEGAFANLPDRRLVTSPGPLFPIFI